MACFLAVVVQCVMRPRSHPLQNIHALEGNTRGLLSRSHALQNIHVLPRNALGPLPRLRFAGFAPHAQAVG